MARSSTPSASIQYLNPNPTTTNATARANPTRGGRSWTCSTPSSSTPRTTTTTGRFLTTAPRKTLLPSFPPRTNYSRRHTAFVTSPPSRSHRSGTYRGPSLTSSTTTATRTRSTWPPSGGRLYPCSAAAAAEEGETSGGEDGRTGVQGEVTDRRPRRDRGVRGATIDILSRPRSGTPPQRPLPRGEGSWRSNQASYRRPRLGPLHRHQWRRPRPRPITIPADPRTPRL